MLQGFEAFFDGAALFFLIYLSIYASYLFLSVATGAYRLYQRDKMLDIKNELKHDFYFPVSILVPAYNEEVTILDSVRSLLDLDYRLYEVIILDDGSKDRTTDILVDAFHLTRVNRPIRKIVACQPEEAVYEGMQNGIRLTLIRKKNGGKGDTLNMGINASHYPYFVCIDADSMLQKDSLEKIVQPVMENDKVVAVGGLIRVAQCIHLEEGNVISYHLPHNLRIGMQVMEYDRSFLASRIFMDGFNGNLIISGAFGLFKKEIVAAAGGYDSHTLGEDMELVMKLHAFCRCNDIPYSIRYEPNAVCWSQAPGSLGDLAKQRRRWHLGLFQSLVKYRNIFMKTRYGLIGSVSYLYYLVYELLSPFIEVFGLFVTVLAAIMGYLSVPFMIGFYLLYAAYGAILTITAFFQRVYTQKLKVSRTDMLRAVILCFMENIFFHFFLSFVRVTAFAGYRRKKLQWGSIKREKHSEIQ